MRSYFTHSDRRKSWNLPEWLGFSGASLAHLRSDSCKSMTSYSLWDWYLILQGRNLVSPIHYASSSWIVHCILSQDNWGIVKIEDLQLWSLSVDSSSRSPFQSTVWFSFDHLLTISLSQWSRVRIGSLEALHDQHYFDRTRRQNSFRTLSIVLTEQKVRVRRQFTRY